MGLLQTLAGSRRKAEAEYRTLILRSTDPRPGDDDRIIALARDLVIDGATVARHLAAAEEVSRLAARAPTQEVVDDLSRAAGAVADAVRAEQERARERMERLQSEAAAASTRYTSAASQRLMAVERIKQVKAANREIFGGEPDAAPAETPAGPTWTRTGGPPAEPRRPLPPDAFPRLYRLAGTPALVTEQQAAGEGSHAAAG
jgi:hypothetical protein